MNSKRFAWWLAMAMIFATAMTRVVPHPWNFTPLIAMALFGGAKLERPSWAVVASIGSLLLSDLALGLFPYQGMGWIYGTAAAVVLVGTVLRRWPGVVPTVLATLGSGMLFYAVTNFGVWAAGNLYPRTAAGLVACYVAGLPFYRNQVAGDLFFTGVLFGLHLLATSLQARYRVQPSR